MDIKYIVNDKNLHAKDFIRLANSVWPKSYNEEEVTYALSKTINITAWSEGKLVGCVRILTDYVFFGTITEIMVIPNCQKKSIGSELLNLVRENTPTKLYFGAQPDVEKFYEKNGCPKGYTSFTI